jgi:type IV secretion system protein VirB10
MDRSTALDATGVSAIKDTVNRHLLAQFLGVAAYALVSSESSRSGSGLNNDRTFAGDVGEGLRDQFAPLARKYLDLVPTITLRPGTPLRIFFEDDIYATPWASVNGDVISQGRNAGER